MAREGRVKSFFLALKQGHVPDGPSADQAARRGPHEPRAGVAGQGLEHEQVSVVSRARVVGVMLRRPGKSVPLSSRRCREVVALGREVLGGNGILTDFNIAKAFCDIEAFYSYEVRGQHCTGSSSCFIIPPIPRARMT